MLAGITFLQGLLAFFLIAVCVLLMGIILLQKGRGGGLSGAFGGGGGTSAFGSKTGDVLTWFTVALAGGFLLLAVVGNYAFDKTVDTRPQLTAPGGEAPASPGEVDLGSDSAKPAAPQTMPAATQPPPAAPAGDAAPQPVQATPAAPAGEASTTGGAPAGETPTDDATADESASASAEQP